jgi:hypothetical protein
MFLGNYAYLLLMSRILMGYLDRFGYFGGIKELKEWLMAPLPIAVVVP